MSAINSDVGSSIDLTIKSRGLGRIDEGLIIKINPNKVPRVIGKQGSMVTMIKQATGCQIIVGQNGVIWLEGSPQGEIVAVKTIEKIEQESHISGLTERVQKFLEENKTESKVN